MNKLGGESQIDKFKRLAKETGADEEESVFEDRLRRIAKTKPNEKKGAPK
jgi:hypothetical protein